MSTKIERRTRVHARLLQLCKLHNMHDVAIYANQAHVREQVKE